ncbi:adenine phosphoribosyltransferase [Blochmannia endosymbiont of Camponotus (Colobopsis) obliquus]|uniref:adenine phosphoribosyltransferase n=1 Tax=Blochmannia endosymbiont of Camponotus (Colobopsis) obliquus TaxID=1505597 RepID=UPI00061A7456|nr:adenine phosphoribosyltransferase [Blochmannia endosymbiont of Camponotus (Colobopsis) obliquus]AKC60467.1 adenine phosphoribosyltransferase [Blochmannia endosymbiont of Camponotus (Colobopsis) obliquus]
MNVINQRLMVIKQSIRSIPNYPKPGILFRDITGLLENPSAYSDSIMLLAHYYRSHNFTKIVGIEARGFLFSAPVALILKLGCVLARKPGKLPFSTISEKYFLEYGTGQLEMHKNSIYPGDKVLVIDDVLATGGTVEATVKMVRRLGGEVQDAAFLINLKDFGGETLLANIGIKCYSLLIFLLIIIIS